MWNWNKAIVALVTGLVLPGLIGDDPWIIAALPQAWIVAVPFVVAILTWLVPNGVPVWQTWKASQ